MSNHVARAEAKSIKDLWVAWWNGTRILKRGVEPSMYWRPDELSWYPAEKRGQA